MDYKSSGVNIDAGNNFVDYIKSKVQRTFTSQVVNGIGGYASLFSLKDLGINLNEAMIVTSTDGVGTKLEIAMKIQKHDTIGIDLVAMCVNDLLCQGAKPLFFLDYIACGKIESQIVNSILDGIIEGCTIAKMSLIGGETAEMPGLYNGSTYDLAGFATGIVEKSKVLPRISDIKDGDILIGLHSSGLHSNGFSLVRKIIEAEGIDYSAKCDLDLNKTWGEFLLEPTKIYVEICEKLTGLVHGFAHITGGGITENLPRILPEGFIAEVDQNSWQPREIFSWLKKTGNIRIEEMFRVFNMGIGMICICSKDMLPEIKKILYDNCVEFSEIGKLKRLENNEAPRVEYVQV